MVNVPKKITKLNDVSDLPAKCLGKDKATAGWESVRTLEVNMYIVKRNAVQENAVQEKIVQFEVATKLEEEEEERRLRETQGQK